MDNVFLQAGRVNTSAIENPAKFDTAVYMPTYAAHHLRLKGCSECGYEAFEEDGEAWQNGSLSFYDADRS